jgi:hypothetical protein
MTTSRFALAALLTSVLSGPVACSGENGDPGGDDAPPVGDDGADDGADDGGDETGGDDDGGEVPADQELCEGLVVDEVTSKASTLAGDSSLAVTAGGTAFVAFTGEATTEGGEPTTAIYLTRLGDDGWSEPERVPADPELAHQTPALVADGDTLHLAWSTTRADSAVRDIFYATRSGDGEWSEPGNLTAEENGATRTSTAARAIAVDATGSPTVVYGTIEPNAFHDLETIRVHMRSGTSVSVRDMPPASGRQCTEASARFDGAFTLHVAAACFYQDEATGQVFSSQLWRGLTTGGTYDWSLESFLTVGSHLDRSLSLLHFGGDYSSLVWENGSSCDGGICGRIAFGVVDHQLLIPSYPSLPDAPDATGSSPTAVADAAHRVTVVHHRTGSDSAGDLFAVRSQPVELPWDMAVFGDACKVGVEPDGDERSPEAVVDPASGEVHVLFQVVEDNGVRLAHARLPPAP